MKLSLPFSNLRKSFSGAVAALFDSAADNGIRTSTIGFPIDHKRELRPLERRELVKKCRSLRANLGFMRRVINGVARYTVGQGLIPSAATSDPEFNKRADAYFDAWASSTACDVTGQRNFFAMQKTILREMFCDGEVFVLQVRAEEGPLQLQLIKTDQIGTSQTGLVDGSFYDGIQHDPVGKPVKYRVIERNDFSTIISIKDYDAEDMIHVFDPERINQRRGLPWMYHGANSAVDILDLVAFEKASQRVRSYMAATIETESGGVSQAMKARAAAVTQTTDSPKAETRQYAEFLGGAAIPVLKKGEKLNLVTGDRSVSSFKELIDFIKDDLAYGFGVNPAFIGSLAGMGGANTRGIFQDAQWFFDEIEQLLVDHFCQRVYSWVISNAILSGELEDTVDPNPTACHWQSPPAPTVDKGRDGKLYMDLIRNGMMTRQEWWSMQGKDGAKQRRAVIDEIAEDIDYCKQKGVPFGYYLLTQPGQGNIDSESLNVATQKPLNGQTSLAADDLEKIIQRLTLAVEEGDIDEPTLEEYLGRLRLACA